MTILKAREKCPFCGGENITNHLSDEMQGWRGYALCRGCSATGPVGSHRDEDKAAQLVMALWDYRVRDGRARSGGRS